MFTHTTWDPQTQNNSPQYPRAQVPAHHQYPSAIIMTQTHGCQLHLNIHTAHIHTHIQPGVETIANSSTDTGAKHTPPPTPIGTQTRGHTNIFFPLQTAGTANTITNTINVQQVQEAFTKVMLQAVKSQTHACCCDALKVPPPFTGHRVSERTYVHMCGCTCQLEWGRARVLCVHQGMLEYMCVKTHAHPCVSVGALTLVYQLLTETKETTHEHTHTDRGRHQKKTTFPDLLPLRRHTGLSCKCS